MLFSYLSDCTHPILLESIGYLSKLKETIKDPIAHYEKYSNNWKFTYYDEIIEACGKAFDIDLDYKYRTQQEIQRLLHY